jgi:hypothetical protein
MVPLLGCASETGGAGDDVGGNSSAGNSLGAIQIAVVSAPSNLSCLRVTITGNVTSVQFLSVTPGSTTQFSLMGLPTGAVTVHAEGFNSACTAVTMTSIASWISNTVSATLVAGVPSTVALTMTPNGTATVQINFPTPTTTTTDTTPPTLTSFTPPNGATNVAKTTAVIGNFSEPVNLASITPATFAISDGSLAVPGNYTALGNSAAFTPSLPLGPAQTYSARINPGVRDLAGNALVSGASWSFRTQDGTWDSSQILSGTTIVAFGTASGRGPGNETFAMWAEVNSAGLVSMIAERFIPGTGWTSPQVIESGAQAFPDAITIVVDNAGNATAIWEEFLQTSTSSSEHVLASHFTSSLGWSVPQLLDTNGDFPTATVDPAGNVTAAWLSFSGVSEIVASQFTAATGWSTPQVLQTLVIAGIPIALAADPSGDVTAVWSDGQIQFGQASVWADRFVPGSGWGTPQLIEDDDRGTAGGQRAVADASGNVLAVWNQSDGTHFNIVVNRFVPATGWGTPQIIDSFTTGDATGPALGMDAGGNAIATWIQTDTNGSQVAASRFSPASGWSAPQVIAAGGTLFENTLVVDGAGNAMAAWVVFNTSNGNQTTQFDRFTPATGWAQPLTPFVSVDSISEPLLTADGIGRVTVGLLDFNQTAGANFPLYQRFE